MAKAKLNSQMEGLIRPYRPMPADFRAVFIALGWDGIEDHYRTNWRCIRRWIEEAGGEELRAARRAVTGSVARPSKRSRYVLGRTLTAVTDRSKMGEG